MRFEEHEIHRISSAFTTIAAFVGWAAKGPTDRAVKCASFGEFDHHFGASDPRSYLGYAISHFFENGGRQAYVIRLAGSDAVAASAVLDGLRVTATGPGTWAEAYTLRTTPKPGTADRFRLDIVETASGSVVETYGDLSLEPTDGQNIAAVLRERSALIAVTSIDPGIQVTHREIALSGAIDEATPLQPGSEAFSAALIGDGATTGIFRLNGVDLFNIMVVPGHTDASSLATVLRFCHERRSILIVDPPHGISPDAFIEGLRAGLFQETAANAAIYYPWITAPDPLQGGALRRLPPSGAVAGIYARMETAGGVWKAPAGTEAVLAGIAGLAEPLSTVKADELNAKGINCLRAFPGRGVVVWGARTMLTDGSPSRELKYVSVRRLALFIEESVIRGLKWAASEPNAEPLWAQVRASINGFLHDLFRSGAFQGVRPEHAYFVKCGRDTMEQDDIDNGFLIAEVGFAPFRPAEFVLLKVRMALG